MSEEKVLNASGMRELAAYLDISRRQGGVETFDITPNERVVIKKYANGETVFEVRQKPFNHAVSFSSLDDFRAYVKGRAEAAAQTRVHMLIGERKVTCDLNRHSNCKDIAELPIPFSAEFCALKMLANGVNQKELWRILVGDLDGCFPAALCSYVGSISASFKDDVAVEIDRTGIGSGGASNSVGLVFANGTAAKDLPVDWTYTGRIFECMEDIYEVQTRINLEVTQDGPKKGLKFSFILRRLDWVREKAHADLRDALRLGMPDNVLVHSGEFSAEDKYGR